MTIFSMVNADKEGQIESKMMKAVGTLRFWTVPNGRPEMSRKEGVF